MITSQLDLNAVVAYDLIQAEDAKSFIDLTSSNLGNDKLYRTDGLDIFLNSQKTVRYVGSIDAGERLDYSIKSPSSAEYQIDFNVATNVVGIKSFDVLVNGVYQDTVDFQRNGADLGWEKFQPVFANVKLSGGTDDISIVARDSYFNIDSFKIVGTPVAYDLIQAENAKSFIDLTNSNLGNDKLYRKDGLDIFLNSQKTVRYVGHILAGERLDYSINSPSAAEYQIDFNVATNVAGIKSFDILVNGVYQDTVAFQRNGADLGWEKFQPVSANVKLTGGTDDISIVARDSNFNIDSFQIIDTSAPSADASSTEIIFENDFDTSPLGTYTTASVNAEWNNPAYTKGIKEGRAKIVDGISAYKGRALEITYPKGMVGSNSGVIWQSDLGGTYEEVVYSYYVRFAANFPFNLRKNSGKVLGLAGGDPQTGGDRATGYDGWSNRLSWGNAGIPRQYVYHVDQPSNYGQSFNYQGVVFKPGTWHKIETRMVMNTPGQNDGIIQSSFDGALVLDKRDFNFRETDAFAIDTFLFHTFFGGNTSDFAPLETTTITFDEIVVKAVSNVSDPIIGNMNLLIYEAEDLDVITNFRIENVSAASKGSALSLVGGATNEIGKASLHFGDDPTELAGEYRLSLRYFDENDGRGQIRVLHSDVETASTRLLGSFVLDRSSGSHLPVAATLFTYDLPATLQLSPGDKLHIEGYENLSEHIRIDQLLLERI